MRQNYIPNIRIKRKMLEELGLKSSDELFSGIPEKIRITSLNLPEGKSELELKNELDNILATDKKLISFLGAGIYSHWVPSAVKAIAQRSEFYTSYTPYQPEVSQGILQALFEYQSVLAELLGMDVVNASMYDGSTALAEAMLMTARITGKTEFIIPRAVHWEKKSVLKNYATSVGIKLVEIPYSMETGELELNSLKQALSPNTSGVYVENPNCFGVFERSILEIKSVIRNSLLVAGVNPLTLGLVKAPGDYNADIVVGEGQVLGNSMHFGGSTLGIFGCRKEYVRQLPGRLIGLTQDSEGRRAFCITLQTREQHIRRQRATSNICTNETLYALNAVVYLALLGSAGLRKLGLENLLKAKQLATELNKLQGFRAPFFRGYHFNEFVLKSETGIEKIKSKLLEKGIDLGIPLEKNFPELRNTLLCAVTEIITKEDIKKVVETLKESP